ncbi:MAG: NAD(P)-dependent oxidoreductase [Pseudomonadota bacterium]
MTVSPENTTLGFIGLGVMGKSMASHLLDAGYPLHVYTRTKEKARPLCSRGAVWEDSPAALAARCNLIITIVGYPSDVEQVWLGEGGLIANTGPGSILIDMTTSSPELAVRLFEAGRTRSVKVLDAPVSGGDMGARNAALSIMVGGEKSVFQETLPVFEAMGKNIVFQGPAGSGQHTKLANQMAIAAGLVAVCEALAYSAKAGLDPATVLKSIGAGAAGSWSLNNLGPRMIAGDFAPGFYVKHFIKDMTIALESSKALGLDTPGLILARELYKTLAERGYGELGTQALYKLFVGEE